MQCRNINFNILWCTKISIEDRFAPKKIDEIENIDTFSSEVLNAFPTLESSVRKLYEDKKEDIPIQKKLMILMKKMFSTTVVKKTMF